MEDSLHFTVASLRQQLRDPAAQSLFYAWSRKGTPEAQVAVGIGSLTGHQPGDALERDWRADGSRFAQVRRTLTFRYGIVREGETEKVEQEAGLVALPMRFGGSRWWLECPRCHSYRAVFYLPVHAGGREWRCRSCYRLRYLVQRLDPAGRTELRMKRISERVHSGGWASWLDFPPPKPKWMRHPTYARHVDAWQRAEAVRERVYGVRMLGLLAKLNTHHNRRRR